MADTAPLLQLEAVGKRYGTFQALDNIDLALYPGEFVCLVGPSGCGKSTLLRLIAGLARPSTGRVLYRGAAVAGVNPYATIVFQTFALFPWLTVLDNVTVALQARGLPEAEQTGRAEALVTMVGLEGFESAYPRELSGGMRQKVGFARALAVEPELLCLDEPFSALDVLSAETLRGELMELWLGRRLPTKAILMVTHNIEEAVHMADRIIVLGKDPGHLVRQFPLRLQHPRRNKDTAFMHMVDVVYGAIAGRTGADTDVLGTAPGLPGHTRKLPGASLDRIGALTEQVAALGERTDLYHLADELAMDMDGFLSIVKAAELLGLVRVDQGDLFLTRPGRMYAQASIGARREIIAGRIFRVPLIRWLFETLQKDDNGRVDRGYFEDLLQPEFGPATDGQIDIAIAWARFAELFAYDSDSNELYLTADTDTAEG